MIRNRKPHIALDTGDRTFFRVPFKQKIGFVKLVMVRYLNETYVLGEGELKDYDHKHFVLNELKKENEYENCRQQSVIEDIAKTKD